TRAQAFRPIRPGITRRLGETIVEISARLISDSPSPEDSDDKPPLREEPCRRSKQTQSPLDPLQRHVKSPAEAVLSRDWQAVLGGSGRKLPFHEEFFRLSKPPQLTPDQSRTHLTSSAEAVLPRDWRVVPEGSDG